MFDEGDSFEDLGEAFLDADETGSYNSGERFFDFNNSGSYDDPDGFYSGLLCSNNGQCSSVSDTVGIGQQSLIIMAGSGAVITSVPDSSVDLTGGSQTVVFQIGDLNSQPMPAGTTIALETTNGEIVGPSSFEQPCTASQGPIPYAFTLAPDDTSNAGGVAFLTVTTPGGIISTKNLSVKD